MRHLRKFSVYESAQAQVEEIVDVNKIEDKLVDLSQDELAEVIFGLSQIKKDAEEGNIPEETNERYSRSRSRYSRINEARTWREWIGTTLTKLGLGGVAISGITAIVNEIMFGHTETGTNMGDVRHMAPGSTTVNAAIALGASAAIAIAGRVIGGAATEEELRKQGMTSGLKTK